MKAPSCPRCGGVLRLPDLMSSESRCARHGPVLPLRRWANVTPAVLRTVTEASQVPLWAPLPLPPGWTVSGLESAQGERDGARAVTLALCGPSPLGGPVDLLLISEEPGIGLAARRAGVPDLNLLPLLGTPPDAKVETAGHPTALWRLDTPPDRVAFAGEAGGVWFVAVLWPPSAELLLLEHVALHDLRAGHLAGAELAVGAPTPRLD